MTRPLAATLCLLLAGPAAADEGVTAFVKRHCLACHAGERPKAGLDLTGLASEADSELLTDVLDRVRSGEMPPEGRPRPAKGEVAAVAKWLRGRLNRAGPRTPLRRLNRVEYEYTLRDLLHTPHLDIKEVLPPDASADGFDNVASAQDVSYVQLARYLEAAGEALDRAMCLGPRPEKITRRYVFQKQGRFKSRGKERGETRHVDKWVVFLRQPNNAQTPWRLNGGRPFAGGEYTVRVRCRGVVFDHRKLLPQDRRHVASIYTREKRLLKTFDVPAEASVVEFKAWMYDRDQLEFFCASLDDRNSCGAGPTRPYRGPGIAVEYVEVEGPLGDWPRPGHRALFGDLPVERWTPETGLLRPAVLNLSDNPRDIRRPNVNGDRRPPTHHVVSEQPLKDAERLLRRFMARAYRRPPEESEVRRCLAFAREGLAKRQCFQDAMRTAYKTVLCSPDFLFLREPAGRLDGHAVAARLSYFLWRSMPDEALTELAASGELLKPDVLRRQAERMLKDPRAERFVEDFTRQWLDLDKIHDTATDRFLFPEYFCDNHLVESAVAESRAYFREMLTRDLGAKAVVASDFVMINERLARLYGIRGVEGSQIRRVGLNKGTRRGGFLTQASVLKVTANGLTTSPVLRGAWVLDRLLGRPAPPPPPDAGSIDPDTRGATTVREQLRLHRRNPSCASCHKRIDPPGFALEGFDVMGAVRANYRSFGKGRRVRRRVADRPVRYKAGPKVDTAGEAADGAGFRGIRDFRRLLLKDGEQLARNLAGRLLTFATGAGVKFKDRDAVERILKQTAADGHGLRSMIHAVIQSEPFLTK